MRQWESYFEEPRLSQHAWVSTKSPGCGRNASESLVTASVIDSEAVESTFPCNVPLVVFCGEYHNTNKHITYHIGYEYSMV